MEIANKQAQMTDEKQIYLHSDFVPLNIWNRLENSKNASVFLSEHDSYSFVSTAAGNITGGLIFNLTIKQRFKSPKFVIL